jgi:hypothetical protein
LFFIHNINNMKQFFAILFLGLLITSCNNDDPTGVTSQVVGNWKVDFISQITTETSIQSGTTYIVESAANSSSSNVNYLFSEGPNNAVLSGTAVVDYVTTSIQPANLFEPFYATATIPFTSTSTWSLEGDKMTFTNAAGATSVLDVIELTDTKLHLKGQQTTEDVPNQGGGTSDVNVAVEYKMTKQ